MLVKVPLIVSWRCRFSPGTVTVTQPMLVTVPGHGAVEVKGFGSLHGTS